MATEKIIDDEVSALVERTGEAARAWMQGDMDRYLELTPHARGFTLMHPGGAGPTRFDDRAKSLRDLSGHFRNGDATLEEVETHAWDDTIVLVMIERQHGEVGDLPHQDWPLRVTMVYRRDGSDWLLIHRHADPLVHPITSDQMSALARGSAGGI